MGITAQQELEQQIRALIETTIRPKIQEHTGDIEFIALEGSVVKVSLKGACIGCPFSFYTLVMGIQQTVQERFPTISQVISV